MRIQQQNLRLFYRFEFLLEMAFQTAQLVSFIHLAVNEQPFEEIFILRALQLRRA